MKYSLLLTLCLLLIVALAGSMVFYLRSESLDRTEISNNIEPDEAMSPAIEFPPSQAITETPALSDTSDTKSIREQIIADIGVIPDISNQGQFIVYGEANNCLEEFNCRLPFSITYDENMDFFTVVLYELPLREVRERAQTFLSERYRLTPESLCSLRYMISVPFWVSEEFAGVDLRFSGCSDAVQL